MSGQYAAMYRRAREALEMDAEIRLERPLTVREQNLLRNCGTLTMLDSIGMIIYSSQSAEELAERLSRTSMDSRFSLAHRELVERLSKFLQRPLHPHEVEQLQHLGNIEAFWEFERLLHEAAPDQREATLQMLLAAATPDNA